jgi:hypothetical protein
MANRYRLEFETNVGSITTAANGTGSVTVKKLSSLVDAMLSAAGYSFGGISIDSANAQKINFTASYSGSVVGVLQPAGSVTFAPGTLKIWELGN